MSKVSKAGSHKQDLSQKEPTRQGTNEFYLGDGVVTHDIFVLARNGHLTKTDILLYLAVRTLERGKLRCCIASNKKLGEYLGVKEWSVSTSFAKLIKHGLVVVEYTKQKNKTYNQRRAWSVKDTDPNHPNNRARGYCEFPHEGIVEIHNVSKGSNLNKQTPTPSPLRGSGDRRGGVGHMPHKLVPDLPNGRSSHVAAISQRALRFADVLHEAVLAVGFTHRYSRVQWAKEMEKLLQSAGAERSRNALYWFEQHIRDQYTPKIRSAKKFRIRFADVEAAAARHNERNPDIQITQQARDVALALENYNWPKGSSVQLPAAVQQSMANFGEFHARLDAFCTDNGVDLRHYKNTGRVYIKPGPKEPLASFAFHIRQSHAPALGFFEDWYKQVYKSIHGWKEWSGKLPVLEITGDKFQKMGLSWAQGYSGSARLWHQLMKELGYESGETGRLNGKASRDRDGG